ncbi:hypothetical protein GGI12_002470 [Dipsacomyces acuminosporus]|nr:hypothetical protein GGI12_002470 [Dipsacomyces acuminosporus]
MVLRLLKRLNYQYEVTVGLYTMETWEKYIINYGILQWHLDSSQMPATLPRPVQELKYQLLEALCPWHLYVAIEMVLQSLKKLNYQYEVTTGLYMMENWEKYIVNSVVCGSFALVAYTTFNHLPTQGMNFVQQLAGYAA